MTVSNINAKLFTDLSAINGRTLSTLTAVNGQTLVAEPDDPSTISNLELWMNPRSGVSASNGNPIDSWTDSSTNAYSVISAGSSRPIYRSSGGANNQPYVEFDGSDDAMSLPDNWATGFSVVHLFIVVKVDNDPPADQAQSGAMLRLSTSGSDSQHYPYTDGHIYDNLGSNARKDLGNPTPSLAAWHVYEVLSKSGTWTAWINGTQQFTTGTNTTHFNSITRLGVSAGLQHLDGNLAEIIVYSRDINSTEIATVKTYLNYWYGITIA